MSLLKGNAETERGRAGRCGARTEDLEVEKTNCGGVGVEVNLDGRVLRVEVLQEERKGSRAVVPHHEDIVLEAEPNTGGEVKGAYG